MNRGDFFEEERWRESESCSFSEILLPLYRKIFFLAHYISAASVHAFAIHSPEICKSYNFGRKWFTSDIQVARNNRE